MWFKVGMVVLIVLLWCRQVQKLKSRRQPDWTHAFRWAILAETGALAIVVWLSAYPTKSDAWTVLTVLLMVTSAATESLLHHRLRRAVRQNGQG